MIAKGSHPNKGFENGNQVNLSVGLSTTPSKKTQLVSSQLGHSTSTAGAAPLTGADARKLREARVLRGK